MEKLNSELPGANENTFLHALSSVILPTSYGVRVCFYMH